MELVPIKIEIRLKENGQADYPDWSLVAHSDNQRPGRIGGGWHYDQCGHTKSGVGSPIGIQYGMLLVSAGFANAAVSTFPDRISIMTEAEAEDLYNNKVCAHMPDLLRDVEVLNGLKVEYELRKIAALDITAIEARIAKAIDPDDVEPGIRRNSEKTWTGFKAEKGVSIKS